MNRLPPAPVRIAMIAALAAVMFQVASKAVRDALYLTELVVQAHRGIGLGLGTLLVCKDPIGGRLITDPLIHLEGSRETRLRPILATEPFVQAAGLLENLGPCATRF